MPPPCSWAICGKDAEGRLPPALRLAMCCPTGDRERARKVAADTHRERQTRRLTAVAPEAPTGPPSRIRPVRVAVVDVGANTLRLLVAESTGLTLEPIREERRRTGLGEDVERHGRLTDEKITRSADVARKEVRRARKLGAVRIEVVVTSPWRNASNGGELVSALTDATGIRARPLTAEEEAELGFTGAVAMTPVDDPSVAVCDVGGGSTQLAVGSREGPTWLRSVPLGSLRLTERCLPSNAPTKTEIAHAREEAAAQLECVTPPPATVGLATGGTAPRVASLRPRSTRRGWSRRRDLRACGASRRGSRETCTGRSRPRPHAPGGSDHSRRDPAAAARALAGCGRRSARGCLHEPRRRRSRDRIVG
jgi:exopolyphosphatase/guanosine-5'-triphosphate,3'-diphosphate pyrophosphatase